MISILGSQNLEPFSWIALDGEWVYWAPSCEYNVGKLLKWPKIQEYWTLWTEISLWTCLHDCQRDGNNKSKHPHLSFII